MCLWPSAPDHAGMLSYSPMDLPPRYKNLQQTTGQEGGFIGVGGHREIVENGALPSTAILQLSAGTRAA